MLGRFYQQGCDLPLIDGDVDGRWNDKMILLVLFGEYGFGIKESVRLG